MDGLQFDWFWFSSITTNKDQQFLKKGPIPSLFIYFADYNFNNTNWKSVDSVLGIGTRSRRMVGADETPELWHSFLFGRIRTSQIGD